MIEVDFSRTLVEKVADLDEKAALALVHRRLDMGHDPLEIVEDCEHGMRVVGQRYERHEYFLAGLIMAGEIFRQVMEAVKPSYGNELRIPPCLRLLKAFCHTYLARLLRHLRVYK